MQNQGWVFERHSNIKTEDSYLMQLWRIPCSLEDQANSNCYSQSKESVLLIHGMSSNGATWFCNTRENSYAYLMAEAGYDVWIMNNRATGMNEKVHEVYGFDEEPYWPFSFTEVGIYDIPASIDYILQTTGKSKLSAIAHSMGTTAMIYSMSDKRKDYFEEKLNSLTLLAAVSRMTGVSWQLEMASEFEFAIR